MTGIITDLHVYLGLLVFFLSFVTLAVTRHVWNREIYEANKLLARAKQDLRLNYVRLWPSLALSSFFIILCLLLAVLCPLELTVGWMMLASFLNIDLSWHCACTARGVRHMNVRFKQDLDKSDALLAKLSAATGQTTDKMLQQIRDTLSNHNDNS